MDYQLDDRQPPTKHNVLLDGVGIDIRRHDKKYRVRVLDAAAQKTICADFYHAETALAWAGTLVTKLYY